MSCQEIEVAIHTDSRHADQLRSAYSSKETDERGYVAFKRIDFLGSRKSFEMLKRVNGDNNSNVYELLIRAWDHTLLVFNAMCVLGIGGYLWMLVIYLESNWAKESDNISQLASQFELNSELLFF